MNILWLFSVVSAIEAKQLLKVLAISQGSPLSRESTVGTWDTTVFKEVRDLIPFHVFLILFRFFLNIYHNKPVYFSS